VNLARAHPSISCVLLHALLDQCQEGGRKPGASLAVTFKGNLESRDDARSGRLIMPIVFLALLVALLWFLVIAGPTVWL